MGNRKSHSSNSTASGVARAPLRAAEIVPDLSDPQIARVQAALTSVRHHWVYYDQQSAPASLVEALRAKLPHLEGASGSNGWGERLARGGAYVNGRPVKEDSPLPPVPFRIEYYESRDRSGNGHLFKQIDPRWIVYQDRELIVINKPAGLSCNQAREQHVSNLKKLLESYLGRPVHLPSRLDTSAQGLVIVSTAPRMHRVLQQVYERHRAEKYYLLAVSPPVNFKNKLVECRLGRDPRHSVLRAVVQEGGDEAVTYFTEIARKEIAGVEASIILAKPRTGRTHQLRVQMAHLGSPIIGDNFYSGAIADELHLLSIKVKFFDGGLRQEREFKLRPQDLPAWVNPDWIV